MKSNLIAAEASRLTVGKPPVFAILCRAIWAASLWLAFHHQLPGGAIDPTSFMVSP